MSISEAFFTLLMSKKQKKSYKITYFVNKNQKNIRFKQINI